jgi:hypothetical protein
MVKMEGSVGDISEYSILEITVNNSKTNKITLSEQFRSTHNITVLSEQLKTLTILPR